MYKAYSPAPIMNKSASSGSTHDFNSSFVETEGPPIMINIFLLIFLISLISSFVKNKFDWYREKPNIGIFREDIFIAYFLISSLNKGYISL